MNGRSLLLPVGLASLALVACASSTASPSSGSSPTVDASFSSSPSPSAAPSRSPASSPIGATSPTAEAGGPPDAWLTIGDGPPIVAAPAGGCWRSGSGVGCASSPLIVPEPGPQATPAAACEVAFSDGTQILYGRVSAFPAAAADPSASITMLEDYGDGPPGAPFSFTCPDAGDWVLVALLHAAPGDKTYYWRLLVH